MTTDRDLIIIGAGGAGLSAAQYASVLVAVERGLPPASGAPAVLQRG